MPGFNISGSGGDVDAKIDILRSYRWRVNITANAFGGKKEDFNLALEVDPPDYDFEILEVEGLSLKYKIPKQPKFGNINLTFYDFSGLQEKFENWMSKIWNPTKGLYDGGDTSGIKGDVKIGLLDNIGNDVRLYTLVGAWPKRLSHSKLSMSDNSFKTIVVEFAYDYYTLAQSQGAGLGASIGASIGVGI